MVVAFLYTLLASAAFAADPIPGLVSVQKTSVAIQRNVGFECADLVDAKDFTRPVTQTEAQARAREFYGTQTLPANPNAPDPATLFVPNPGDRLHGASPVQPGQDPRPPGYEDTQLPAEPGLEPPPLTVKFESIESGLTNGSQQLLILRVSKDAQHKSEWSIIASLRANEAFARRKLLTALNYKLLPAQLWPKLTIHFDAKQYPQKKQFLERLAFLSDRQMSDWVVSETSSAENTASDVTIRNLVLTTAGTSLDQVEWGIGKDFADIDSRPERFTDTNCALRQLLLPWVLLDIGEKQKINAFAWRIGAIQGDSVVFMHRFAKLFRNTTYTEVRRIGMEIASKPITFWTDVMMASKFPQPIIDLLIEKVKSRRNDLVRLLDLKESDLGGQPIAFPVWQNITIQSKDPKNPHVQNGKLLTEIFPGWPHSFRAPDNKTPLTPPEIARFIGIEALAAAFEQIGQEITTRYLSESVQDAVVSHQKDLRNQLIDAIENNKPFVQRVGQPWVKPIGSAGFSSTRRVTSGSYYGGDIKAAQQVDSVSANISGGLFLGLDNIPRLPVGTAFTGTYTRNWLHLKPLDDPSLEIMKKAFQNDKSPLLGPFYFGKLAHALKKQASDTSTPTTDPDNPQGGQIFKDPLQSFLDTLEVGESLMVADTLAGSAQTLIPIADILNMSILGSTIGLTPSIGYQQAIIKKTKIQRRTLDLDDGTQVKGLQIDISSLPPHLFEVGFDVGWLVKLIGYAHGWGGGEGTAWSFQIPDPATKDERTALSNALTKILVWNDSELLMGEKKAQEERKTKYTSHKLIAKVKSQTNRFNALFYQRFGVESTATLAYQPPAPTADEIAAGAQNFNPADRELDFWVDKKTLSSGNNFLSFLLSFIPKLQLDKSFSNPQNNLLGSTKTTNVTTEAEFTDYREALPQTTFESHIRGTQIKKDKLLSIVTDMSSRLGALGRKFNIRQEATDEFAGVDTVKLYDASEVLTLKNDAFKKIRDALQIHPLDDPNQGDDEADLILSNLLELEGSLDESVTPARVLRGDQAWENGVKRHRAWCALNGAPGVERDEPLLFQGWPMTPGGPHNDPNRHWIRPPGYLFQSGRVKVTFRCVKPWMTELLAARKDYMKRLKKKPAELYKTYTELASLVGIITKGGSFPQFLAWLGEPNFSYQIRVTGFRVGSEQEGVTDIGLEDYASSTIGAASNEIQGTIQSLIREKRLSPDTVTNLLGSLSGEKAQ